jgi:hypothetical protein
VLFTCWLPPPAAASRPRQPTTLYGLAACSTGSLSRGIMMASTTGRLSPSRRTTTLLACWRRAHLPPSFLSTAVRALAQLTHAFPRAARQAVGSALLAGEGQAGCDVAAALPPACREVSARGVARRDSRAQGARHRLRAQPGGGQVGARSRCAGAALRACPLRRAVHGLPAWR